MQTLIQDLRYGVRMLMKKPGFTLIAVLTLALGIGANTAIFSVVNAVLLRPLPFHEPDRLMAFWVSSPGEGLRKMEWTEGLVAYFRDRSQTFEKLAAYDGGSGFNLTGRGEPGRLSGATVTYDFFHVFGREPLYGRTFLPHEDMPGANNVTILSYELWQKRFGGDPAIVGQPVNLNNIPTVVVGVMPSGFDFPNRTDLWVPVGLNPQAFNRWYIEPIGRLKPGVTAADAQREIATLWNDIARQHSYSQTGPDFTISVTPLKQLIVGRARLPILILLGAVGLVLLIACANIANLLMARAAARGHELAVRCCLGASRRRIIRQLLTESLLLALMGSGGGLLLALWGVDGLKRLAMGGARIEQLDHLAVPLPRIEQAQIDLKVLLFTVAVALLTGLLCGLVPALRASRVNLSEAMKDGGRTSASGSNRRLNNAFVIAQIALSLVLLVGAALLLESFKNLLSVDPGFSAENVWAGRLELPSNKYANDAQLRGFYGQLLDRVQSLPGVRAAGLCQRLPFFGGGDGNVFATEGREPRPNAQIPSAWWRDVSPGYFAAMGIPVLKGRPFQSSDTGTSLRVAIVDETFARVHWPNEDPIGRRMRFAWGGPWMTVVGVVANVKHTSLEEDARFYVYWPTSQDIQTSMYLVIRTANNPEALTSAVFSQVKALDPELPLFEVRTMAEAVAFSLSAKRLTGLLLACFAVTALLLAMMGIYGVMALNVGSRTSEFGVRLALGAQSGDVLKLVIGQGIKLALIGVALGVMASLALTRLMKNLLYGVSATDPLTFISVALLLCGVALVACWIPARRATKVDPMIALRSE